MVSVRLELRLSLNDRVSFWSTGICNNMELMLAKLEYRRNSASIRAAHL
jgi:hypothetical protein